MPEFAERFFRSGSLRIHVRDWGDTALPSLVLVHGLRNLVRALRLEKPILVGHSMGGEIVSRVAGSFPDVPSRVVMIEGLGPPPIDMEDEWKWTVDGFARI